MPTTTKTWTFDSDEDGWSANDGSDTTSQWQSGDGDPSSGCVESRIFGRNKSNEGNYYEVTGTWESLFGIAAGQVVTAIETGDVSGPFKWACPEWNIGGSPCRYGPFEILDSSDDVIATIAGQNSPLSGTDDWEDNSHAGQQSIGASYQASDTSIKVRLYNDLATGNNGSAAVTLRFDTVALKITHVPSGPYAVGPTHIAAAGATHDRLDSAWPMTDHIAAAGPTADHLCPGA